MRLAFCPQIHTAVNYLERAILSTKCDTIRASLFVQRKFSGDQIEFLKRRLLNKIQSNHRLNQGETFRTADGGLNRAIATMNSDELRTLFRDQKSLINCLTNVEKGQSSNRASPSDDIVDKLDYISNARKSKEPKEIVEELTTINDKLRQYFDHLVESLEKSQAEVTALKDENSQLRKELFVLKSQDNANKAIPELPPLEPPKLLYLSII
ncbi:hypothetical protein RDWZM_001329 [Blomia tropicalis]|uniref:Uncharacterized protein n=1 Tax=Blomia tropicalis TaxID=40697 RepID=A0A9Q0MC81_BLOTA|nr:hypothetical protein RDWZM_001329 [Blomia tropicalis]